MRNHPVDAVIPLQSDKVYMIHAIYLKSRPKNKWHLVSYAATAEEANLELEEFKQKAIDKGNEQAEAAIQTFESIFWVPEYISEIKKQNPILN